MLLDTEATENESNISIVNVLKKDFIVARTEAVRKYNFKTFFSKQKKMLITTHHTFFQLKYHRRATAQLAFLLPIFAVSLSLLYFTQNKMCILTRRKLC